jgi:hypothetical protein
MLLTTPVRSHDPGQPGVEPRRRGGVLGRGGTGRAVPLHDRRSARDRPSASTAAYRPTPDYTTITRRTRWSLGRGNAVVPSRWRATRMVRVP